MVAEQCFNKENWGIISAVLGNKQNRNTLVNSLWFNKDFKDLQKTLKEDKIYDNSEWKIIKTTFETKLNEILAEKKRLHNLKKDYEDFLNTNKSFSKIIKDLESTEKEYKNSKIEYDNQKIKVSDLSNNKKNIVYELSVIKSSKPNFFTYWFNRNKRNTYKKALETALNIYNQISDELSIETPVLLKKELIFKQFESLLDKQKNEKINLASQLEKLTTQTEKARLELKNNYADAKFWENIESKKSQESCPWYSEKLKKLQSELFIISLKLNEVFILTANIY